VTFPPPRDNHGGGSPQQRGFRFEAEHPYGDPEPVAWKIRYRHPSSGEKDVRWESLNGKGERVLGLLGRAEADMALYREQLVRDGVRDPDEPVLLVESESSVDALIKKTGHVATTWAGGAASPPVARLGELLRDHPGTLLIPDYDEAGLICAERLIRGGVVRHMLLGRPGTGPG
jgi:hypothetical protein